MNKLTTIVAIASFALPFTACKKEPKIEIPPSDGSTLTLQGIAGSEAGTAAGNSVYVDLSTDKQTSVKRTSWDLGFYSGADFRVILNNSTAAGAKVITSATDLASVGEADTVGQTLAFNHMAPTPEDFKYYDAISGHISSTAIPAVSPTASDNKVIILNRGTGGGIAPRPWIKLRVTRNNVGGYILQYGTIKQTTGFKTLEIQKDGNFNFKFVSLNENGSISDVEPRKTEWDIVWGYSGYQTSFNGITVPYNFSDLVFLNVLAGVEAAQIATNTKSYTDYSASDIATTTFSSKRDLIGSNWRITQPATGIVTNVFYVIKDGNGNIYKLRFISMGVGADGGVRGKPVIEYKLVKQGK